MFALYVTCLLVWALRTGSVCWRQSCSCFLFLSSNPFLSFPWVSFLIATNFPLFCCRFLSSFPQLTQHHYLCVQRVKHTRRTGKPCTHSSICLFSVHKLNFFKGQWEVTGTLLSNMITYTSGSQTIWLMTLENVATSACDPSSQGTYAGQFFLGLNHF